MDDPRGQLALVFLAIADRFRPRWVVWENVPGVLSSVTDDAPDALPPTDNVDLVEGQETVVTDEYDCDETHALACFLAGLSDLGYGCAYRVLDAQYFGVAQRRRRVFVVGYLRDWRRAAAVLLERESLCGHPSPSREKGKRVADPFTVGANPNGGRDGMGVGAIAFDTTQITSKANYSQPKPGDPCRPIAAGAHAPAVAVNHINGLLGEVSGTIEAQSRENRGQSVLAQAVTADMYRSGGAVAGNNAQGVRNCPVIGMSVRRLTPRECERLQGFPDNYTLIPYRGKAAADDPRYCALGNSMAVPVMAWIGRRIAAVELERAEG
jgi:DNA (cytosine-5)-methyltransferase 1